MNDIRNTTEGLTKKERRELRRQEAREGYSKAARDRGFRRILTWAVVAVVLGGIGWLVWRAAQNAPNQGAGGSLAVEVSDSDNIRGEADAQITLVEYGDYQCPACAAFHPIVEQLLVEGQGNVRLVYRHFPLKNIHPNAEMAAQAVQASALQGKFWEMHAMAYERQSEWAPIPRSSARAKMLEYASELGLDVERLEGDMDSDSVKNKVDADLAGGEASGVNSTPSFFVNGELVSDFSSVQDFYLKVLGRLETDDAVPATETNDDANSVGENL